MYINSRASYLGHYVIESPTARYLPSRIVTHASCRRALYSPSSLCGRLLCTAPPCTSPLRSLRRAAVCIPFRSLALAAARPLRRFSLLPPSSSLALAPFVVSRSRPLRRLSLSPRLVPRVSPRVRARILPLASCRCAHLSSHFDNPFLFPPLLLSQFTNFLPFWDDVAEHSQHAN
ncbi:hypothetical protein BC826DRAFT_480885 [Russula brevipes]|nr:hypothetical protein BC826DRAFT_480885 [Russula brevipes]